MELGLVLIVIGIVLAIFLNWTLGVILLVVGCVLLLLPYLRR